MSQQSPLHQHASATKKRQRQVVCLTTTKPTTSLTPGGGGGSVTLLCPLTGSILSSLRASATENASSSHSLLGISSLTLVPTQHVNNSLAMAVGGTARNKDDTFGLLLNLASSSPTIRWKRRLPEPQLTAGLAVSPCGYYVVGGAASGTLYIWKSATGALLRSIQAAHYRAVTVLCWTDCGRYLLTGGADGMVHLYNRLDLVAASKTTSQVQPIRTWSQHALPVTALLTLEGGRVATASKDGQVLLLELCSQSVLASMNLSHPVTTLAAQQHVLWAGDAQGTIHAMDLDEYALAQTQSQFGVTIQRRSVESMSISEAMSISEQVFGTGRKGDDGSQQASPGYRTELRGHDCAITALAVVDNDSDNGLLVSGDRAGCVRVWDLSTRTCVRVLYPWSHSSSAAAASDSKTKQAGATKNTSSSLGHPVTSISILEQTEEENNLLNQRPSSTSRSNAVPLFQPLQKYEQTPEEAACVTVLPSTVGSLRGGDSSLIDVASIPNASFYQTALQKRKRKWQLQQEEKRKLPRHDDASAAKGGTEQDADAVSQQQNGEPAPSIEQLEQELAEAKSTIQRWETVNNKLMARLQEQS